MIPNFRPISLTSFTLLLRVPNIATNDTSFFSARTSCSNAPRLAGMRSGRRLMRAWIERNIGWLISVCCDGVVVSELGSGGSEVVR